MGLMAVAITIDVLVSSACLYVATKKGWVTARYKDLMTMVGIVAVVSVIPRIGWPIGVLLFIALLMVLTDIKFTDSVWIAVVTKGLSLLIFFLFALALS